MEEKKNLEMENANVPFEKEEQSAFDFAAIYTTIILNWKWFALSLIICLGVAAIYLRYTTPIYQAYAKLLIKDNEGNSSRNNMLNTSTLGMITNSNGIDNEMEILSSHSIAEQAVRDLKLYVNYYIKGKIKYNLLYKTQPISVDVDPAHLEKLNAGINLDIVKEGNKYHITGTYYVPISDNEADGPFAIDKTFSQLPATIGTRAGILSFSANPGYQMQEGQQIKVVINSPKSEAYKYVGSLSVSQTSKTTTIAQLVISDESPQRAVDYLKQLAICYNRQANEDKNEIAVRTEEFINGRLEKINAELGNTEGQLENYKKSHNMVELKMNAGQAVGNADQYSQKLAEISTQVELLNSINDYMNQPDNRYQTLPSNVGLTDASATSLINKYNEIVLQRNRLLRSASENSPTVTPLTSQLEDLSNSIRRAMSQARRNVEIQRNAISSQFNKYQGQIQSTPEQERMLTQIGRQQEVKSGLYLMLLQKREENSISLAATADKGKLIDDPAAGGKVSPKSSLIMLIGLIAGLAIPAIILYIVQLFRYKIEGHDDVASLTTLPIIADVAVASETAKTKADIVVHENKNTQMEEIFRSMRTNIQFMLKENQKTIMFTSTTTGEGKTFTAANLAVSFALLGKKVVLVGLDIRKPRLAQLFEIDDKKHGITNLIVKNSPNKDDILGQIVPSGINNNLDLLMAGPIPPNPAELVARTSLDDIMGNLREMYDYILIDTAPVGLVTDTLQISRVADVTVYMCRADYTPKESFELINSLAAEKKLPTMCVVLNGIDMSKKKYGYYYGYGRYGKYGRYGRYNSKSQRYGAYGSYGRYGSYGAYGSYGSYANSHYGDKNDTSIKV
ncbi:MAG: polysaccharide biosynthesis tyrosine autokinase [Prevotella sp.]|nr:polysaccharide biosynthesis tyrosine autokinase [Prevotella sp.]MCI7360984.1 polysaccharide biosynthesis tyrosine autokinase [Prevotella sp.]MDD6867864.1 polysaccharide biosynthesis tyrosine autokinase [Prevotella sp.]MDY3876358.1 polysaccharide biosynthesis tyrosine autokinase [Prevotella sp.]MDY5086028.1 polysaccharide biosynthesis tyrosine autokinase [Prevotella sp.]